MLVKGWRNSESHISPTASEQEVDIAISIIVTMYFYATGLSITDLKKNGHDITSLENAEDENTSAHNMIPLYPHQEDGQDEQYMVAEQMNARSLPEARRIDILKKSIRQLLGYAPKKSPLNKQRHWIAIYRIAADKGLVKEGDFANFKKSIDDMQISDLPVPLKIESLQNSIKGVYARNIINWTGEHLKGRELAEFEDIKRCADAFAKIVDSNMQKS